MNSTWEAKSEEMKKKSLDEETQIQTLKYFY